MNTKRIPHTKYCSFTFPCPRMTFLKLYILYIILWAVSKTLTILSLPASRRRLLQHKLLRTNSKQTRALSPRLVFPSWHHLKSVPRATTSMAFKIPCFSRKNPPESNHLPGFRYADLQHLEIIGQGSFSAVFTARLGVEDDQSDTVVVKKLLGGCDEKEFMKEAWMLHQIRHQNVVRFKWFCPNPCAIMLEFVYFDFSPFGEDKK